MQAARFQKATQWMKPFTDPAAGVCAEPGSSVDLSVRDQQVFLGCLRHTDIQPPATQPCGCARANDKPRKHSPNFAPPPFEISPPAFVNAADADHRRAAQRCLA
jgi:hypothetical protein